MPSSSYEQIASEYYHDLHVTSRNFDHATLDAMSAIPFDVPKGAVLEIGAGRGRAREFLRLPPGRIVQLDNSDAMFKLEKREECFLKVFADACSIPLISQQFSAVVGFLVDPFMGLNCLGEAFRMLSDGGRLLLTVPTKTWGTALREPLGIDVMTTRFEILGTGGTISLPSLLHS